MISVIYSDSLCACHSGKAYGDCCQPYHTTNKIPENPVILVRSRYCAYSLGNVSYIMATTHHTHKEHALLIEQKSKYNLWEKNLKFYTKEYKFVGLLFVDEANDSVVTPADSLKTTVTFQAKVCMNVCAYVGTSTFDICVVYSIHTILILYFPYTFAYDFGFRLSIRILTTPLRRYMRLALFSEHRLLHLGCMLVCIVCQINKELIMLFTYLYLYFLHIQVH